MVFQMCRSTFRLQFQLIITVHVLSYFELAFLCNGSTYNNYSLFTFSRPRFESGSLRNDGMLICILRIYFAVDGMPIEMYGESWIAGLLTSDVVLYMAGFGTT